MLHQHGKWRAQITVNKRIIVLGNYVDLQEAVAVRRNAECCYFGPDRQPQNYLIIQQWKRLLDLVGTFAAIKRVSDHFFEGGAPWKMAHRRARRVGALVS